MELFEKHFKQQAKSSDKSLSALKISAFETFKTLGFPKRQDENWRYTNVSAIAKAEYQTMQLQGSSDDELISIFKKHLKKDEVNIVFIDGDLSLKSFPLPESIEGLSVKQVLDSKSDLDPKSLELIKQGIQIEDNGFTALNRAMVSQGIEVCVKKNIDIQQKMHVLFVHTDQTQPAVSHPRLLVRLESNSSLQITETHLGKNATYLNNLVTDIDLQANARLTHYIEQLDSPLAFHVSHANISLDKDAHYESFDFEQGAKISRSTINTVLKKEGSHVDLNGLYLPSGNRHIDTHVAVDHQAPNCTSSQFFKGVLDGTSRGVFNGKIFVRKKAQKTEALQTNKNLLLSTTAEIDTKPQLEIDADDVKCSHGAAIGQINEDEVFYLKSRGISDTKARQMLCQAFAGEAALKITDLSFRKNIQNRLAQALQGGL